MALTTMCDLVVWIFSQRSDLPSFFTIGHIPWKQKSIIKEDYTYQYWIEVSPTIQRTGCSEGIGKLQSVTLSASIAVTSLATWLSTYPSQPLVKSLFTAGVRGFDDLRPWLVPGCELWLPATSIVADKRQGKELFLLNSDQGGKERARGL